MAGVTLDTGALIAIERGDRRVQALLAEATMAAVTVAVPAGVIAQAWCGSARPARLAQFLALDAVVTVGLDDAEARAAGVLCGARGTSDIVDASVVICARARGHGVVTGDPEDIAALDPALGVVAL